jgi:cell division protein FtsL
MDALDAISLFLVVLDCALLLILTEAERRQAVRSRDSDNAP